MSAQRPVSGLLAGFDQQLDMDGGRHDIARETRQERLFTPAPAQLDGQMSLGELDRSARVEPEPTDEELEAARLDYTPPADPDQARAEAQAFERSVACPACGAGPGSPCMRPSGHRVFGGAAHAPRFKLALRADAMRRRSASTPLARPTAAPPRGWKGAARALVTARPGITIPELAAELQIPHARLYRWLPASELRHQGRGWYPA